MCNYAGITSVIRQSGKKVNIRLLMSKMVNPKLRNLLFMRSFNTCKYNQASKALFDRIVATCLQRTKREEDSGKRLEIYHSV
ncbi:transposase [Aquimarina sp. M1]